MDQKKDIAVILPVYNGANMLEACLQSVFSAGERVTEIIIVDDGSTDGTLVIAQALAEKDSRIRVIHTENHGCYAARRTGIMSSISPYIAFCDVDDRYIPGALDILAGLLEEKQADVAMGGYKEITSYDEAIPAFNDASVRIVNSDQMWLRIMKWKTQEFVNYVWNKLYKRELLENLIEADKINQGEDVLITCQAFLGVKTMVETTAPIYLYYHSPESLTHSGFGDSDLNVIRVWDKVVEIMKEKRLGLLAMAQFNRWRTDFTMITRLILVDDKALDRKYAAELQKWRAGLKAHWKDLITPHAMPRNRELLVVGLRFLYRPTKAAMRLGRKLTDKETSVILHSGDKR